MAYDQKLNVANDIIVMSYYKKNILVGHIVKLLEDIVVNDISDLLIGGTVNATIGEDSARDINKTQLFCLINSGGGYSTINE